MSKIKCYECGERQPEEDTTLVPAMIGGDYRRAARHGRVRVCRECTQRQVDNAAKQSRGDRPIAIGVNTGRITWEYAARVFGIEIPPGTLIERMTGRRAI